MGLALLTFVGWLLVALMPLTKLCLLRFINGRC
jgi:hypothetical protein